MLRRLDTPATAAAVWLMATFVATAAGFVEGTKVRACPARLDDGRQLAGIVLKTGECRYTPSAARPLDAYPPEELRRIANFREREALNRRMK